MFLCCVGCKRCMGGHKVGCWPIVGTAQQKKRGKRGRGEWKFGKKSIDYELYKEYLIDKVLPMLSRLPRDRSHNPDGTPRLAWNSSKPEILNDLFLTLQSIMKCIIEQGGKNDYKFPRLHKDKLKNRGLLPQHLKCNVFEMTLLNGHI
ncbi:unnamed protein product, partial [Heterosigma akashiwo]